MWVSIILLFVNSTEWLIRLKWWGRWSTLLFEHSSDINSWVLKHLHSPYSWESWRSKLDEDGERGPVLFWSSLHLHLPSAQSSMVMSSYKSQKINLTKSQPQYKQLPDHNHQPLSHNSIAAFLLAHSGLWLLPDVTQVSISWNQNDWETATRHVRNLFETTLIHWGCRRETNNKLIELCLPWNQRKSTKTTILKCMSPDNNHNKSINLNHMNSVFGKLCKRVDGENWHEIRIRYWPAHQVRRSSTLLIVSLLVLFIGFLVRCSHNL